MIIFGNNALKHLSFSLSLAVSVCLSRCLNACTYCKTKHARGDLASYPIEELVERTRQSFQGEYTHTHEYHNMACNSGDYMVHSFCQNGKKNPYQANILTGILLVLLIEGAGFR